MRKLSPIEALFPDVRSRMLDILFSAPDKWWYLSSLANEMDVTPSSLQRELQRLIASGILEGEHRGNRIYFRANRGSIIFDELQRLVMKTSHAIDAIRQVLLKFKNRISVAFVFGSFARGEQTDESDIDVLIIGSVELADLAVPIRKLEQELKREISVIVMSRDEALYNLRQSNHFLQSIAGSSKIYLIRGDHELESALERRQTEAS